MRKHGKLNLLGVRVDATDYHDTVERIVCAARSRTGMTVSALAVHGVMTGVLDPVHRYRLNHLDLLVPDGQPVRWALNLLHDARLTDRVYGPRLMLELCGRAAREGLSIYLYGSRGEVLERLQARLSARLPGLRIAGAEPSRFRRLSPEESGEVVARIRVSGAAITLVGLGCPRQEIWAFEHRDVLGMPIVAVGAAFDFHAGTLARLLPSFRTTASSGCSGWCRSPGDSGAGTCFSTRHTSRSWRCSGCSCGASIPWTQGGRRRKSATVEPWRR
jgi:N-acetylglucosaminyldiphosphoundecaprenol N-acetyl-beta-D-mannosaminyltransferase